MRYYLDTINNSVFAIENFEYELRENQDIEITKDKYDEFLKPFNTPLSEEDKKNTLRKKRRVILNAFDKWEKAVLRGREVDSEEIMNWYESILDLDEEAIKSIPNEISYYL